MRNVIRSKNEGGFSLIELMIVVGIIGILATLALPRFKTFQAKARSAESRSSLQQIYTLEQSYALDNSTFASFTAYGATLTAPTGNACGTNGIGFAIDPCVTVGAPTPRFAYSVTGASATNFTAVATTGTGVNNRVCPVASNLAVVSSITEANSPGTTVDVATACTN